MARASISACRPPQSRRIVAHLFINVNRFGIIDLLFRIIRRWRIRRREIFPLVKKQVDEVEPNAPSLISYRGQPAGATRWRMIAVVLLSLYGVNLLFKSALGALWFGGVLVSVLYHGSPPAIWWLVMVTSTSGALLFRAIVTLFAARSLWRRQWKLGGIATAIVVAHQALALLPGCLYRNPV